jgi:hypothetical protein
MFATPPCFVDHFAESASTASLLDKDDVDKIPDGLLPCSVNVFADC